MEAVKTKAPKQYRVGVVSIEPNRKGGKPILIAYIRPYLQTDEDTCFHHVMAATGAEARRIAIKEHAASSSCEPPYLRELTKGAVLKTEGDILVSRMAVALRRSALASDADEPLSWQTINEIRAVLHDYARMFPEASALLDNFASDPFK